MMNILATPYRYLDIAFLAFDITGDGAIHAKVGSSFNQNLIKIETIMASFILVANENYYHFISGILKSHDKDYKAYRYMIISSMVLFCCKYCKLTSFTICYLE